jgi:hypothetical protein
MLRLACAILILALPSAASAAEYLEQVRSEVYPAAGDQAAIAARGKTCMARILAPGVQGGQLIVSDDGRDVVASNVLRYSSGMLTWEMRSRVVFEARDGRFRVTHEGIERFNDTGAQGWYPVGKWFGSGWKDAEAALQRVSASLANCVAGGGAKDDF